MREVPGIVRRIAGWLCGAFTGPVLPLLAALLPAAVAWTIYHPGLLDSDTAGQYVEAVNGDYGDWHSPAVALLLAAVFACGGGFAHLTLAQAVLFSTGLYQLAVAALTAAFGPLLTPARRRWLAAATLALLAVPVSPLLVFLVLYNKDGVAAVLLIWASALTLRLHLEGATGGWRGRGRLAVLLGLLTALPLVRPNLLLVLPVLAAGLLVSLKRFGWKLAAGSFVGVVLSYFGVNHLLYARFPIARQHAEDQVLALDLVGLCVRVPEAREKLPFTSSMLVEDKYRQHYLPGIVDPLFPWYGPGPVVKPGYVMGNHTRLMTDYVVAMYLYPGKLARLKWQAFVGSFDASPWFEVYARIEPNSQGIQFRPEYEPHRSFLARQYARNGHHRHRKWIAGKHVVWLVAALALTALAAGAAVTLRAARAWGLFLTLLIPVAYYASFIPCTAARHYRYYYPATVQVQVIVLAFIVATPAVLAAALRRWLAGPVAPVAAAAGVVGPPGQTARAA